MSARQVAARGGSVLTGMLAAALVAEGGYRLRDHGAFPHVNFYLPDAQLGVRLRPGATERISFGGNPVTQVRINADGYRGAELPPPRPDEILVVGDSQAFGLGVEEDQTFSARLAGLTGRPVVNAGVPTYGPEEYDAVVAEMLARRKPSLVVYTVNMANDLFETGHPNRERHAVWDGWAVRKDGEVKPPAAFPGRSWLFGRSHLVFALRKIARGNRPEAPDRGLASEGTWIDLLGAARQAESGRRKARDDLRAEVDAGERARGAAESQVERVERSLGAVPSMRKLKIPVDDQLEVLRYLPHLLHASRASVGDIVDVDEGEGTRPVPVTAELLEHAGVYRRQLEEALRDRGNAEARRLFDEWRARTDTLHALEMAPAQLLRHSSPLLPHVARMKELAAQHGARLVVLVLPLDVMVSAAEWAKYRAAPVDLAPARLLVEDLTRASEESGVAALDATAVLAAAEPGAFLDHDLHLTPRGHLAVARALAAKIAEAPPELPTGALPADRSPPPTPEAWLDGLESGGEFLAHEDDPRGPRCIVRHAGQWWRVDCSDPAPGSRKAQGVTLLAGGRGDALGFTTPSTMRLTAPVLSGDTLVADFAWTDVVQHLEIGTEARFSRRPVAAGGPSGPTAGEAKLLSCLEQDKIGQWRFDGAADADCLRTYGDDCTRLLACAAGRPASPPDCPAGSVTAGVFHRCHQLCGAGRACPPGQRCDPWPGAHLCE